MKQLRIRAYLQTPVISDKQLPLDAIMYYHHVRFYMGEELLSKSGESSVREAKVPKLPFKKGGRHDESWFYHCSFAQWPERVVEQSSFKVKSGDWIRHGDYLSDKTKKIDNQRGKHKAGHIKMYYRMAEYVEWYCVGDEGSIMKLLRYCTAIGKNTGDGWGQVLRWELADWPEDWSIRGHNNKLMRAVPYDGGIPYGVRPSYWNPRHIFRCIVP
jgi:CRISPR type IV-associated protein Csf3